jgi:peroxiredoxin (alkyl hydroperoxide reductase subunit C)
MPLLRYFSYAAAITLLVTMAPLGALAESGDSLEYLIYDPGTLEANASEQKLSVGDEAPDFELTAVSAVVKMKYTLSQYRGKNNVVLSFVPAAWTPICSRQWPGYCDAEDMFEENDSVLLGIATDNIPTLHAWTSAMKDVWFPVLSDFWPHGKVAGEYGVLRSDGVAERALFVVDKEGIIRYAKVYDINAMPDIDRLEDVLVKINEEEYEAGLSDIEMDEPEEYIQEVLDSLDQESR